MKKFSRVLWVLFAILVIRSLFASQSKVLASAQATFYISPNGNDGNPGTETQPFKTLEKARDTIRTINSNMSGDIIVYLRAGTYTLSSPLIFNQNDSGTNGFNIIYRNYPGETPIISGGKRITGWQQDGNKWKAYVGTNGGTNLRVRQMYVNGVRAIRARSVGVLAGAVKTQTGYTITDQSMQNWQNQSDVEIVSNVYWKQFRCGVQSITNTMVTIKQPCFGNAQKYHPYNIRTPTWIENAFELLDSPGEWYFNRATGWIYYLPRPGENMASANIVIPVLETLVAGTGTAQAPISNIKFRGLTFAYATWLRPSTSEGFAHTQADFSLTGTNGADMPKTPANITFKRAKSLAFERNKFIHLGGVGLSLEDGSQDNLIVGNHFTDISASAITLGDVDKPKATNENEITQGNTITNNYIHDVAVEYQGSVGIWAGYVKKTLISHNEIFNLPYSAISIGWGWGRYDPTVAQHNTISHNLIYQHVNVLADGGGVYSLSAQPGNTIKNNVIKNQANPFAGIYLDDASRYITVEGNVIFNNARSALIKGRDHYIYNNFWQDRGPRRFPFPGWDFDVPDIWFFDEDKAGCNNGQPTSCGWSRVENNHLITSLAEVPPEIIANAGLEPDYRDIKNLPPPPIVGDLNSDGRVDIFDYNLLVQNFGSTTCGNVADIDGNCKVDIFDYNILVENVGK